MPIVGVSQFILATIAVIGMAWIGVHNRATKKILIWSLIAAFVSSLILSFPRLWPTEFIAAEFGRTGNMQPYLTWNVKYFFIDFIPRTIIMVIITLGASITARITSVRWGKPHWAGILCGTGVALLLLIPAVIVGIQVLLIIIPGSWP